MSIFNAKPALEAEKKISARDSVKNKRQQTTQPEGSGALCSADIYHYASSPLQRISMNASAADKASAAHSKASSGHTAYGTSLPTSLQSGIQALSGLNLGYVKVHYNSAKPALLGADAYAQGSSIHLAPGREQHLPHEAWHIVQQREQRVPATGQINGQPLNNDKALEHEADVMGNLATNADLQGGDFAAAQGKSLPMPSNAPVQGYFTDARKPTPFKVFVKASAKDIELVKNYLKDHEPAKLEAFNQQAGDTMDHGTLQGWLASNRLPTLEQLGFPQIRNVPPHWIVSTTTPNDGGPPILLDPDDIGSPTSSQEQDIELDGEPNDTDLVIDLTRSQLPYHRGGSIPVDRRTRSEVRASALLTNEYIDYSTTPLVGRGTDPIKKETDALRKRAREHDKTRSEGKTYSHHPDTFWTQQSHSAMGWHPVGSHTNTLDGDYHQLTRRSGQRLTGLVTKEKRGYTRQTLTAHNDSQARVRKTDALIREAEQADIEGLSAIHNESKKLAVTAKSKVLWKEIGWAIAYFKDVIDQGLGDELQKRMEIYLEIGFDQTPETTATVGRLFVVMAERLRSLRPSKRPRI